MVNEFRFTPKKYKYNPNASLLQNISLAEISGYLCNTLLRDSDVVSMWHGLEVRPILLDKFIVEFSLKIPDHYKIKDRRMKSIFIDAVKDLLPREVLKQPKKGFEMPYARWMNGSLNDHLMDLCTNKDSNDIFSKSYKKILIKKLRNQNMDKRDFLPMVLLSWYLQ